MSRFDIELACPVCRNALCHDHRTLACRNGHSFDIAKQGYVNLLGPRPGRSKHPGYSQQMIAARRSFFEMGFYAPVARFVAHTIAERLPSGDTTAMVLDLGCGEGYYLRTLRGMLGQAGRLAGVDISKAAVAAAARKDPDSTYVVAAANDLPLPDRSVDAVLVFFSPFAAEELTRIVRSGGYVFVGSPGPRHLFEVKAHLYREPRTFDDPQDDVGPGFTLTATPTKNFQIQLATSQVFELLVGMTPYNFTRRTEGHPSTVTVDVRLRVFRRGEEG